MPRPYPRLIGNSRDARGNIRVDQLSVAASVGITAGVGTIYRNSVERSGDIIATRILVDITGLGSSTTLLDIIGTDGVSHLGQITTAENGIIWGGTMVCLEAPLTGVTDIDLYVATVGTGAFDADVTALVETVVVDSAAAWTLGRSLPLAADAVAANSFLYLCNGAAGTVGTYTAGRLLITLFGQAAI